MQVKLLPNQQMKNCLDELVQGREILYIICEPSQLDILKYNGKKAQNLVQHKTRILCLNNKEIYKSIREAAKELGLDPGAISKVVNGKQKSTNGFCFKKTSI